MALMPDDVKQQVTEHLANLEEPVTMEFFPEPGHPASDAMHQLLDELAALSPKLTVERHPGPASPVAPETADEVESSVTQLKVGGRPTGVRYLGFPGGHEFATFIDELIQVSQQKAPELSSDTVTFLQSLTKPLHLEVFVTPT